MFFCGLTFSGAACPSTGPSHGTEGLRIRLGCISRSRSSTIGDFRLGQGQGRVYHIGLSIADTFGIENDLLEWSFHVQPESIPIA